MKKSAVKFIAVGAAALTGILVFAQVKGDEKGSVAEQKTEAVQAQEQVQTVEKIVQGNEAELAKIDTVLGKIYARHLKVRPDIKNELKIENKEEFLADLKKVLDEEEKFPKDDISLYYLIDKENNIEKDKSVGKEFRGKAGNYTPQNLVSLKKNDLFKISRNDLSLRPDVYEALNKMSAAYKKQTGDKLLVISTYRSFTYQDGLFKRWAASDPEGEKGAERYSARPGTSQHQLGSAIDFCKLENSFIKEPMGKWLNTHSEEYGWSLSFPEGYEPVTGYMTEYWHFRYIGIPACELQKKYFNDIQQYTLEFIDYWKKS